MNHDDGSSPRPRILMAEDDPDIHQLVKLLLEFHGFDVSCAIDGSQAWQIANSAEIMFDLFLLDVRMPGLTGFEVCAKLKANPATRDVPVIFLSAKGQESEIQAGLDVGADEYILKPFAPDELVQTIRTVLETRVRNGSS